MGKRYFLSFLISSIIGLPSLAGTTLVEETNNVCRIKIKPDTGPLRPMTLLDLARYSRAHSRNFSVQSHILKGIGYRADLVDGTDDASQAFRKEKLCLLYRMAIDEIVAGSPNPNNIAGDCNAIRNLSQEINLRAFDIASPTGQLDAQPSSH